MHLAKCLTWMSKMCFYRFFVCFKIPVINENKRLRSQGTRGPHRLNPWHIMTPTISPRSVMSRKVSWWSLGGCLGVSVVLSCWIPPSEQTRLIPYHHFSRFSRRKLQFYGYGIFVIYGFGPKIMVYPQLRLFCDHLPNKNMNMWWIDIGTPKQIERQFLNPFLFLLVHPLGVVIFHFQTIPFVHRGER